ncbi:SDR family NAD(P)-dependent oxidoreductase [Christiangramia forsetii]|uniref:Short-chain dehydrogenase/reductase family protein n=2 Tax=Christiangramia forsetii TaxID=411153 RepID=A0M656_CHRFK|nr:SDR family oxidoreductase [Christiangramia forsetii]GGG31345.1 oxidoreductase [Christiangramia forsetii]CAL68101.1 short-chain dehydrogenase/reductase family protein [Christiangramia forsetii KT0803]
MDLKLKGKKAFISGSTKGIGYATAKTLAAEGAEVIINGRSEESVNKAIGNLKKEISNVNISGIACDFSKEEEIKQLISEIGELDILINNVGIFGQKEFTEIPDEEWLEFYKVNVLSGVRLSRAFLPGMLKKDSGRIIFISSESAFNIPVEMIHYGMTKTAQLAVSRGLAETTKGTNVTVNSVLPGPTFSEGVQDMVDASNEAEKKEIEKEFFNEARPTSLIQRFADPQEIANMIAYVASPLSSATNGASLRVDGGVVKTI